ncbi:cation diffusion facilitator family transporter [Deinococcus proteolyticus MRP]|uniref:Cation diffusion facilitator family transporter n=1 Tax=Deinococcus proteolyticus (strain ATCC 35074 / DSM 20540 / JCM 6276 / NBRC 101906 / NCIMB 13154 / VKM Ac-1939 / CCM 2703 / MRP) TaxID=693977 RepID=F0RKG8_DEIPM|nr:cation diffusion facilitator family transporter [Deinococcus proteolyticus]ADY26747.1 cation diffusion facilitator family transporter [Deinococcus proteolyticus MRP]
MTGHDHHHTAPGAGHSSHGGHDHNHGANASTRQLGLALALTGTFLVVEAAYAFISGSLALLSDAGHMLTDAAALALSLLAVKAGERPADRRRTFGYRRTEILAAALNAAALLAVGGYILYEAVQRLREPVAVQTTPMLVVAVLGLIVNLLSARILAGGQEGSLNVRSAYLEVLSDLLGSAAVIVGAILIMFTGWTWVDPLLGAGIGLWVIPRTWRLLSESVNVLLEGAPAGLDLDTLRAELSALPGVTEVHDLHVWSITSGEHSLTVHLVSGSTAGSAELLAAAQEVAGRHGIEHVTVQIEPPGHHGEHAHGLHA